LTYQKWRTLSLLGCLSMSEEQKEHLK